MPSSNLKTAGNGGETVATLERKPPEYGLAKLRDREAHGLISLASDATSETSSVVHAIHGAIYAREAKVSDAELQQMLEEALTCFQAADHYLRMLGSVLDERTGSGLWPKEPAF